MCMHQDIYKAKHRKKSGHHNYDVVSLSVHDLPSAGGGDYTAMNLENVSIDRYP